MPLAIASESEQILHDKSAWHFLFFFWLGLWNIFATHVGSAVGLSISKMLGTE